MDCHRCQYLKYDGCRYGRCTHPGHLDVRLVPKSQRKRRSRPYNRQICREFKLRKKCSNCKYWERGEYFADGMTPARKGKCSLAAEDGSMPFRKSGECCALWEQGPTSWKKRAPEKTDSDVIGKTINGGK